MTFCFVEPYRTSKDCSCGSSATDGILFSKTTTDHVRHTGYRNPRNPVDCPL